MRKVIIVFTGILVFCFNLYSQVHIKEKVEIQPSTNKSLSSTSIATTGIFQIILSGGQSSASIGRHHFENQGGLNVTVPDVSGYYSYHVSPGVIIDGEKISRSYSIKAYFCGDVLFEESGTAFDVFGWGYALCEDPSKTYLRDFSIDEFGMISIKTDNNRCQGGSFWNGEATVTETIESENGVFINKETKEIAGRTVTHNYNEHPYLIASLLPYDSEPEQTAVTKTILDISKSFPYILQPQSRFNIYQESMSFNDMAEIEFTPYYEFMNYLEANLRIISGGEYVSFFNTDTYEIAGDALELYPTEYLNYIIVMDNPINDSVNVIVEFETTGNIQRDTIKIIPFLKIEVDPPIIAIGDTADIIFQTWSNYNGCYENMPLGSLYEVGISENCGNGKILLSDGREGEFFTEVTEVSAKFVAADSVDSDSIAVQIKAGILYAGGGASKAVISDDRQTLSEENTLYENKKANKDSIYVRLEKAIKENVKKNPSSITSCTPAEFNSAILATSEVAVANIFKPWEAKIDMHALHKNDPTLFLGNKITFIGADPSYTPMYLNVVNFMKDVCNSPSNPEQTILGFFRTNTSFPFGQFTIESFKDYKNLYHFRILEEFFFYPVIKELCHDKFGETALDSINDVDDIPVDKLEEARKKIEEQYEYGKGTTYLLKEVYWIHEGIHEEEHRKAIPKILAEEIPTPLVELFHEKPIFKNAFSRFTLPFDDIVLAEYSYRLILQWFNYRMIMRPKISEEAIQHDKDIDKKIKEYLLAIDNRIKDKKAGVK